MSIVVGAIPLIDLAVAVAGSNLQPQTQDFQSRVIANSSTILDADLQAIDTFVLATKGLPILHFSPLAGNDLNAARTKLIYTAPESGTHTLAGTTPPSYSRSTGLVGNSLSYFKSGFIPTNYALDTSAMLGFYNLSNTAVDRDDIGCRVDYSTAFYLNPKATNGNAQIYGWNGGGTAAGNPQGLNLINRSGSTLSLYVNGSLINSLPAAGTVPNIELYMGALNDNSTAPYPTNRSHGCYVVARSMSAAQITTLTSAVNTLMNAFGRGVV